jgi:hypothetical protein
LLKHNNKITEDNMDDLFDFEENNYTEYGRKNLETVDTYYTDNNIYFIHLK